MALYQTLMNEIKNSAAGGAYVQPIPLGMQVILEYSDKGILARVTTDLGEELPFELVVKLQVANVLIQRLQTYKAACKVTGVLVAPASEFKLTKCAGELPACTYPAFLKLAKTKPEKLRFYALDIQISGSQYLPATSAMGRLAMMQFNSLSGVAITTSANPAAVISQLSRTVESLNLGIDVVTGLYIHRATNPRVSTNLVCGVIQKFDYSLDINGYVHGELKCDLGSGVDTVFVPYAQILRHQISNNCFVILDEQSNIQYASQPRVFSKVASSRITCPICGKKYSVNTSSAAVSCVDNHCPSKLYPQICRMLIKFGLAPMSEQEFSTHIHTGKIQALKDVLDLPEYAQYEVTTTLSNLLEAITPVQLLSGDLDSISKFVHQASSGTAVSYYIHNPEMVKFDLKMSKLFAQRFKEFWSDSYNVEMYDAFLDIPDISIVAPEKKFNGDLIFRNKLICLTGEFKHGSYDEMISILKSYAGTAVVEFTSQINFVLVGHLGTPDPYIIERARAYKIPIYRELEFFSAYQIDDDLSKFHLI